MPTRTVNIAGKTWRVFPSGRVTQYDRDEFAVLFIADAEAGKGVGGKREVRVTRYSPLGARSREQSLAEMTDEDLAALFQTSQPGETSPEADYTS
jgi:hypothetical protein